MKKVWLTLLVLAFGFVAQYGYTGSVSPPAPIWADFPAVGDVDINNNNVNNISTTQSDTITSNKNPDVSFTKDVDLDSNVIDNALKVRTDIINKPSGSSRSFISINENIRLSSSGAETIYSNGGDGIIIRRGSSGNSFYKLKSDGDHTARDGGLFTILFKEGLNINSYSGYDAVIKNTSDTYIKLADDLDMSDSSIRNLKNISGCDSCAVNKSYVDNNAGGGSDTAVYVVNDDSSASGREAAMDFDNLSNSFQVLNWTPNGVNLNIELGVDPNGFPAISTNLNNTDSLIRFNNNSSTMDFVEWPLKLGSSIDIYNGDELKMARVEATDTGVKFPDGTLQTTAASSTDLHDTSLVSFTLTEIPANDSVEKIMKAPANDTWVVSRGGITDNNFSQSDSYVLEVTDQYGNVSDSTTANDATLNAKESNWLVIRMKNTGNDTAELTAHAEVSR